MGNGRSRHPRRSATALASILWVTVQPVARPAFTESIENRWYYGNFLGVSPPGEPPDELPDYRPPFIAGAVLVQVACHLPPVSNYFAGYFLS